MFLQGEAPDRLSDPSDICLGNRFPYREKCLGKHVPWGNTCHCNTVFCVLPTPEEKVATSMKS